MTAIWSNPMPSPLDKTFDFPPLSPFGTGSSGWSAAQPSPTFFSPAPLPPILPPLQAQQQQQQQQPERPASPPHSHSSASSMASPEPDDDDEDEYHPNSRHSGTATAGGRVLRPRARSGTGPVRSRRSSTVTEDEEGGSTPSAPRKKRLRTNQDQRAALEQAFASDRHPTTKARRLLSERLNMPERQVQVWFQNRRAKAKAQVRSAKTSFGALDPNPAFDLLANADGDSTRPPLAAVLHVNDPILILPAQALVIGLWKREDKLAPNGYPQLIAFAANRSLCWYINSDACGFKIEIPWSSVRRVDFGIDRESGEGVATFEIDRTPNFFLEVVKFEEGSGQGNEGGAKVSSATWHKVGDFSENQQASSVMRHRLVSQQPDELRKALINLCSSDTHLATVMSFSPSDPPHFIQPTLDHATFAASVTAASAQAAASRVRSGSHGSFTASPQPHSQPHSPEQRYRPYTAPGMMARSHSYHRGGGGGYPSHMVPASGPGPIPAYLQPPPVQGYYAGPPMESYTLPPVPKPPAQAWYPTHLAPGPPPPPQQQYQGCYAEQQRSYSAVPPSSMYTSSEPSDSRPSTSNGRIGSTLDMPMGTSPASTAAYFDQHEESKPFACQVPPPSHQ